MKTKHLEVVCPSCYRHYAIIKGGGPKRQNLILDYAICPFCNEPRRPALWEGKDRSQRCERCGLPKEVSPQDRKNICHPCNVFKIRTAK